MKNLDPSHILRYPLFFALPRAALLEWLQNATRRSVALGETLFAQHEKARCLFLIEKGRFRILRKNEEGREVTISAAGPHQLLGDYSLLQPGFYGASCRAAADSVVWSLPLKPVLEMVEKAELPLAVRSWLKLTFLIRFVRGEAYLGFMSGGSFLKLLDEAEYCQFMSGETIQTNGFYECSFFLITSGIAEVAEEESDLNCGRTLKTGDFCGVETLVGRKISHLAVARTDVEAWRLDAKLLTEEGNAHQSIQIAPHRSRLKPIWTAQRTSSECGVASIVMILRHFDLDTSPDVVRSLLHIDHNGASLGNIRQVLEAFGLSCRAIRSTLSHLAGLTLPAIAHLHEGHYVVVYDARNDTITIGDPARGLLTLTADEFQRQWSGSLLSISGTHPDGSASSGIKHY